MSWRNGSVFGSFCRGCGWNSGSAQTCIYFVFFIYYIYCIISTYLNTKCNKHTRTLIQNTYYISAYHFQNQPHFGSHLCDYLEFLKSVNDAKQASFRKFYSYMSSNKINSKKSIYSNVGSNLERKSLIYNPLFSSLS